MPSNRNRLREERYDLSRRLGFSSREARQMRDWSADRIRANVRDTRRNLTSIPAEERSPAEIERIRAIRSYEAQTRTSVELRGEIEAPSDRFENFREWSEVGFPGSFQRQIERYNEQAGLPDFASFGYRVFYARYVEGMSETDALEFAVYQSDDAL